MIFDGMILPKQDVGFVDRITMYLELGCILFKPCKLWYMCGGVETITDNNVDSDDDDDDDDSTSDYSCTIWYKIPRIQMVMQF